MTSPAPKTLELVKEKGLHVLEVKLDGRYAKKGTMELCLPLGPETAERVYEFLDALLRDPEGRLK